MNLQDLDKTDPVLADQIRVSQGWPPKHRASKIAKAPGQDAAADHPVPEPADPAPAPPPAPEPAPPWPMPGPRRPDREPVPAAEFRPAESGE